MFLTIAFALPCLVLLAAASPVKDNAIANLTLQNYFTAVETSGMYAYSKARKTLLVNRMVIWMPPKNCPWV